MQGLQSESEGSQGELKEMLEFWKKGGEWVGVGGRGKEAKFSPEKPVRY